MWWKLILAFVIGVWTGYLLTALMVANDDDRR